MSAPLVLRLPWPGAGLAGFTSTRQGGLSKGTFDSLNLGLNTADEAATVVENRSLALLSQGMDPGRAVYLQQVHGERIEEAGAGEAGRGGRDWIQGLELCDAVFTRVRGLPLAVGHADCLAVAMADPQAGLLGIAHAGWRGALAGLPGKLARRLVEEGADATRLRAVLSPCLGPSSLELGEEQHRLFAQTFEHHHEFCSSLTRGHFYLDLWNCARRQLVDAGMLSTHIQGQELDTALHPELFYSHRRDDGVTGRMMTVATLL